jgi:hypothetical protein
VSAARHSLVVPRHSKAVLTRIAIRKTMPGERLRRNSSFLAAKLESRPLKAVVDACRSAGVRAIEVHAPSGEAVPSASR